MTALAQRLEELKERLMKMAATAEQMVSDSTRALFYRDEPMARKVVGEMEDRINRLEIENEDAAINLMALYQPEASNLRTITMIIKINNDLERIGDHAENIAQAALYLIDRPQVKPLVDLPRMSEHTVGMLKDSLDAFTRSDADLAKDVCARDSVVDGLKDQISRELITYMVKDAGTIDRAQKLMLVTLNLERIADLATNISEDVIYIVKGESIKHGKGEPLV